MFCEMRRKAQQLSEKESREILRAGSSGVLAVLGDGGYPYTVPLSYVCQDGKIYFHCAPSGHKLDAVRREPRASFCVVAQDWVWPERFTTVYRSVVVFGRIREVKEPEEMERVLRLLAEKYAPEEPADALRAELDGAMGRVAVLELSVEHLTGKESVELARDRG